MRFLLFFFFTLVAVGQLTANDPPDIILMMADDLGVSDLGCYGGEIQTPNLDKLASSGVVFSSFSNTSRCCPSRASLLTGHYSHRVGIGDMNYSDKGPGYRGQLVADIPTLPERLKSHGYSTGMVGKWHLTKSQTIDSGPNGSWPLQRGFDKFFGTMEGAKNYFQPKWLFDQSVEVKKFEKDFFYTNAVSSQASQWIRDQPKDSPLFLYVAFYAPHFPLQAPQDVIEKYRGKYLSGWDKLREKRLAKQKALGLLPESTTLSERPDDVPAWDSLSDKKQSQLDLRMATYAAQVELMDRGVGQIYKALADSGRLDNALIIFLSDNGGASPGGPFGAGPIEKVGKPNAPVKTTYGKGWATLSNTPFRKHKANTHEGGVMAPLILNWPAKFGGQRLLRRDNAHVIDVAPTIVSAATGNRSPSGFTGINLVDARRGANDPVFYEHEKSRAMRMGNWKLVNRAKTKQWELYDLSNDPCEQKDLAGIRKEKVDQMNDLWMSWAKEHHVKTGR